MCATYHVVVDGDPADYDMAKLQEILRKITHAAVDWMQDRPYNEYTFLYHFPRGHGAGGMEHAYGAAIDINADRLRNDLTPVAGVSAHEFFHLWNVKRIRPQSLEPIDYQRENDTRALWFSEGVTTTVGDILLVRAGVLDEGTYLQRLAAEISELQRRPAHTWQSAEESSLDAWFEGDPFYHSEERSISYYNKGDILGVLLDLRIRQLSGGKKSLRDLFHWMNDHYARQHRFFPDSEGVQQAAEAIAGQSFADFFRDYVAGVKEIPYDDFLQFVGLKAVQKTVELATPGFTTTANLGGQPEVFHVEQGSEAQRAGIVAGDRITAVNGKPADSFLDDELSQMRPGTTVRLQVENRKGKREVNLRLSSREEQIYELQDLPVVTPEQRAHRAAWIHGDDEAGGSAVIRAVFMLTFWGLSTLIVGPPGLLIALVTGNVMPLYWVATRLAILGVRLAGVKIVVRGGEHLQPGRTYIFMSNHVSNLDAPVLIPVIPGRCSVLVKKELFRIPILGTGMKVADLVPVDRSDREAAIESVNAAVRVLQRGLHMVVFPEGTRSDDGRLLPFKKGSVSPGDRFGSIHHSGHSAGDFRGAGRRRASRCGPGRRRSSSTRRLIRAAIPIVIR